MTQGQFNVETPRVASLPSGAENCLVMSAFSSRGVSASAAWRKRPLELRWFFVPLDILTEVALREIFILFYVRILLFVVIFKFYYFFDFGFCFIWGVSFWFNNPRRISSEGVEIIKRNILGQFATISTKEFQSASTKEKLAGVSVLNSKGTFLLFFIFIFKKINVLYIVCSWLCKYCFHYETL